MKQITAPPHPTHTHTPDYFHEIPGDQIQSLNGFRNVPSWTRSGKGLRLIPSREVHLIRRIDLLCLFPTVFYGGMDSTQRIWREALGQRCSIQAAESSHLVGIPRPSIPSTLMIDGIFFLFFFGRIRFAPIRRNTSA
jgi:hypothetical protein